MPSHSSSPLPLLGFYVSNLILLTAWPITRTGVNEQQSTSTRVMHTIANVAQFLHSWHSYPLMRHRLLTSWTVSLGPGCIHSWWMAIPAQRNVARHCKGPQPKGSRDLFVWHKTRSTSRASTKHNFQTWKQLSDRQLYVTKTHSYWSHRWGENITFGQAHSTPQAQAS